MTLKIKSKIFYPSHGAGWVKKKKVIEFQGEKKDYFEFQIINDPITISTPIENLKMLGVRDVLPVPTIKKTLTILKKKPQIDPKIKEFNALLAMLTEHDEKGDIESFVKVIQFCQGVITVREKEGRLIPVSISRMRKRAIEKITGEIAVSGDIKYEKAIDIFEKVSGVEV